VEAGSAQKRTNYLIYLSPIKLITRVFKHYTKTMFTWSQHHQISVKSFFYFVKIVHHFLRIKSKINCFKVANHAPNYNSTKKPKSRADNDPSQLVNSSKLDSIFVSSRLTRELARLYIYIYIYIYIWELSNESEVKMRG
jgi:hypothetical protein